MCATDVECEIYSRECNPFFCTKAAQSSLQCTWVLVYVKYYIRSLNERHFAFSVDGCEKVAEISILFSCASVDFMCVIFL